MISKKNRELGFLINMIKTTLRMISLKSSFNSSDQLLSNQRGQLIMIFGITI